MNGLRSIDANHPHRLLGAIPVDDDGIAIHHAYHLNLNAGGVRNSKEQANPQKQSDNEGTGSCYERTHVFKHPLTKD